MKESALTNAVEQRNTISHGHVATHNIVLSFTNSFVL